jgi:quinol monooxygenase YgiN
MATTVIARCSSDDAHSEELFQALQLLAEASRSELGCRSYELYRLTDSSNYFLSFETYDDSAAFAAHQSSEHFTAIGVGKVLPLLIHRDVQVFSA